jgi:hypothetical protein
LITRDIKYYDPIYMGFSMGFKVDPVTGKLECSRPYGLVAF